MEVFSYILEQAYYLAQKTATVEDAEDIIQDVLETVWRKKEYFESKPLGQQKKIISACIQNRWFDCIRYSKRQKRTWPASAEDKIEIASPPSVYALLDLKYVLKKINDLKLECLLDRALGHTTAECIQMHTHGNTTRNLHSKIHTQRKILRVSIKQP